MVKRVKAKRFGIIKLADDSHKSRQDLALKLNAQLGKAIEKWLKMMEIGSLPIFLFSNNVTITSTRCSAAPGRR